MSHTPVVCICGSTRFKQAWISENARLTGEGNIVLAVGLWGHHERKYPDAETKKMLDELHLRKIDLCDWVWVLDVGGYIGESTRNEIAYAEVHGKLVRYLSKEVPDYTEPVDPMAAAIAAKEEAEGRLEAEKAIAQAAFNVMVKTEKELKGYKREKFARMYYQGIVYAVCLWIDSIEDRRAGNGVVCGTCETPSEGVENELELIGKILKESGLLTPIRNLHKKGDMDADRRPA
jgi:hypothetical protein